MRWNLLNLADSAAMHGSSLTYAWLSDGTKVAAKADDGSGNGLQKRYVGSFVFTSDSGSSSDPATEVESIAWDEGRIFLFPVEVSASDDEIESGRSLPGGRTRNRDLPDPQTSTGEIRIEIRDCWFAGDHLGNIRTVVDITSPDNPTILEQGDYLPFGTKIQNAAHVSWTLNRWCYAAKEEQRFGALDLSLLDFGARMYDPFSARWTAVDPLAKRIVSVSSNNYCAGNPIGKRDPNGMTWEDASGNKITDHSNIKVYIFYDPNSFSRQTKQMYQDAINKYGEGSVAMSNVTTVEDFIQDWQDMASADIREVDLNYHGGHQTINLDYRNVQYLSSTVDGDTPKGNPATSISDLPSPSGNIQHARLNINSCRSNDASSVKDGGPTVAQSFRDNTSFLAIRATDKGVSYWYWFSPNRPHPRDDSPWMLLIRKFK